MKRVFKNDAWESVSMQGNVVLCGFYHRYWNPDRTRNAAFDMFSALILDVKEKKEQAIDKFFNQLDGEICDDVTTSGASLEVCRKILLANGAERVAMLALGQSI